MTPKQIRVEILAQHAGLRAMIVETRRAIERVGGSEVTRAELRLHVGSIAHTLREHNRCEEELLRGVLFDADAWGPVREDIMSEEHASEHALLCGAMVDASVISDAGLSEGTLLRAFDQVLEHMSREESAFLNEDVLRDDAVVLDQFGG
jgi:hypothetical protein